MKDLFGSASLSGSRVVCSIKNSGACDGTVVFLFYFLNHSCYSILLDIQ
jgi:hypothetical protein